jgi:tRNA dimethylallyltransferase
VLSRSLQTVFIAGPTAVGKSEFAVALAERLNGEIIGADAFQIYSGLDLLTAKPGQDLLRRIPHHLIGEIPLHESCDVARYREAAAPRIAEIRTRGRIPIICGGTGLYMRALTHGLAELPPADPDLRHALECRPLEDILHQLESLDPAAAAQIDRRNPRRVVRALEVCLLSGRPFSSFRMQHSAILPFRGIFLQRQREDLLARIDLRTDAMFASGVIDEVRAVREISATAAQVIGWDEIQSLLSGKISEQQCRTQIAIKTRQYAKRQATWFRKQSDFVPLQIPALAPPEAILRTLTFDS